MPISNRVFPSACCDILSWNFLSALLKHNFAAKLSQGVKIISNKRSFTNRRHYLYQGLPNCFTQWLFNLTDCGNQMA